MKQTSRFRGILLYVIVILLLLWSFSAFSGNRREGYVSYSDMVGYFEQEQVKQFSVSDDNVVTMTLQDGSVCYHALASLELFHSDLGDLIREQSSAGILTYYEYQPTGSCPGGRCAG